MEGTAEYNPPAVSGAGGQAGTVDAAGVQTAAGRAAGASIEKRLCLAGGALPKRGYLILHSVGLPVFALGCRIGAAALSALKTDAIAQFPVASCRNFAYTLTRDAIKWYN